MSFVSFLEVERGEVEERGREVHLLCPSRAELSCMCMCMYSVGLGGLVVVSDVDVGGMLHVLCPRQLSSREEPWPNSTVEASFMPLANEEPPAFFARNGLGIQDLETCVRFVRERYGTVEILKAQGGCSFTVLAKEKDEKVIVQFRISQHAIPRGVAVEAREVLGELAPRYLWFEELVLREEAVSQVCAMSMMEGVAFEDVQPRRIQLGEKEKGKLEDLVAGLADVFALSWHRRRQTAVCDGKIGLSIRERLVKMEEGLPSSWLRDRALRLRKAVDGDILSMLPIVLNHGDFLPTNILVDEKDWTLKSLVDWAEAEYLPFGMTLYGIEHLLGYMTGSKFIYYQQAFAIRQAFWRRLRELVPELKDERVWKAVLVSREIGMLLWHGIAWDDGKLDRVVNAVDDVEEVAYLEAFLGVEEDGRELSRL